MKRLLFTTMCLIVGCIQLCAQKENPRGLYKLQRITYDDNRPDMIANFEQYKYCGDTVALQIKVRSKEGGVISFAITNNDGGPLNYTGKKAENDEDRSVKVFNSNDKHFTLRWYSYHDETNSAIFPDNTFINELYDSEKDIDPQIALLVNMLKYNVKPAGNKFDGVWRRIGVMDELDGMKLVYQLAADLYKVYDAEHVTLLFMPAGDNSQMEADGYVFPVKYMSDARIIEYQNDCKITWINDDTYTLTFDRGDGVLVDELWKRSGLPPSFQHLFGTNIPFIDLRDPLSRPKR